MTGYLKAGLLAGCLILLAGCSGSPAAGTGRRADLAAEAPGEDKKLILFTSHKPEVYEPIVKEFEARTGIWVQVHDGGTTELLERIRNEDNHGGADVMFGGGVESYEAYRDCFQPYECDKSELLDPTYRSSDYRWTPFTELPIVFIYNNKLVDERDAPVGWEDMLSMRWKGEIAFAAPEKSGTSYTALATMIQVLDMDERQLMERFTAVLDGKVSAGSGQVVDEVANGVRLVGITLEETAKKKIAQGAALTMVYPADGTSAVPDGSAVIAGAAHKENSERFIDFTVSDDVQQLAVRQFMRRTVRTDISRGQKDEGLNIMNFDLDWASGHQDQILELWSEFMGAQGS